MHENKVKNSLVKTIIYEFIIPCCCNHLVELSVSTFRSRNPTAEEDFQFARRTSRSSKSRKWLTQPKRLKHTSVPLGLISSPSPHIWIPDKLRTANGCLTSQKNTTSSQPPVTSSWFELGLKQAANTLEVWPSNFAGVLLQRHATENGHERCKYTCTVPTFRRKSVPEFYFLRRKDIFCCRPRRWRTWEAWGGKRHRTSASSLLWWTSTFCSRSSST